MTIQDLLKLSPEALIAAVERGDVSDAIVLSYPLDTAFANFQIEVAGNFFCCISGSDVNTTADVKFNRIDSEAVTFTQGLTLIRPFARIFLTSAAQAGKTIKFLISSYAPLFAIQDNRSNALQASYLSDILDQLKGILTAGTYGDDITVANGTSAPTQVITAAAGIKAMLLVADKANTGTIYLGFTSAVSATKKACALNAGESIAIDDYRGDVYAFASAAAQKLSASTW